MSLEYIYKYYQGDKVLTTGTLKEIAQKFNLNKEKLKRLRSSAYIRDWKQGGNSKVIINTYELETYKIDLNNPDYDTDNQDIYVLYVGEKVIDTGTKQYILDKYKMTKSSFNTYKSQYMKNRESQSRTNRKILIERVKWND